MRKKLEDWLQQYAYFGEDKKLERANLSEVLHSRQLTLIGQGMNARVFRLEGTDWVIKEGRFDLDLSFITNLQIKFPADVTQDFLNNFGINFYPTPEVIKAQYQDYLKFVYYFGYFDPASGYYHPNKLEIFARQQKLRHQLDSTVAQIEKAFWLKLPKTFNQVFSPQVLHHNFVPVEYLLYGPAISPANQDRDTYFIFQQFCDGNTLHDLTLEQLSSTELQQLLLFAYLSLYLRLQENLAIDLRPRNILLEPFEWFTKTDNIMIDEKGVRMIDTRWFWDLNASLVMRGGIIPEQNLLSTRTFIIEGLRQLC